MAEHQLGLLRITVISPEIPLATNLDRPIAVCFCGRPVHGWPNVCAACGWTPRGHRASARAYNDAVVAALEESQLGAPD